MQRQPEIAQDVFSMVALGLLLSLVFGAVVCGGLGSIARQKNVQVNYD